MKIQSLFSGNDSIHSFSLRFKQPDLENEYRLFQVKQSLPLIRISVLLSILIHLTYLPIDAYVLGSDYIKLCYVRSFILIPMGFFWYFLCSDSLYLNYGIYFSWLASLITGLVMCFSPLYFGEKSIMYFVAGAVMVIMYESVLVGIDFVFGALIAWSLVICSIIVIFVVVPISPLLVIAIEVLIISTMIVTIGAYQYEKIAKFSFVQSRQLLVAERQKHELEMKQVEWFEHMAHFLRHELHNVVLGVERSLEAYVYFAKDESGNKYIVRSNSGLVRIRNILDSVSNASSLESSLIKDSLPLEAIDLTELMQEYVENNRRIYPNNTLLLNFDTVAIVVKGKRYRLVQMLDKIVSNAIEHSELTDPINIMLSAEKNKAVITISNKGKVLPDDNKGLFDLFVSLRKSTHLTSGHYGYGLYVAKQIVLMHKGNIEAHNLTDNKGVEIIISLPILS